MDEDDVMDSWAKHEKISREVKEQSEQRVIGDDWNSTRVRVGAELLQVNTGARCGLLMKFFLFHRFVTFCTAMMIGVGEFFVSSCLYYIACRYSHDDSYILVDSPLSCIVDLFSNRPLKFSIHHRLTYPCGFDTFHCCL